MLSCYLPYVQSPKYGAIVPIGPFQLFDSSFERF